MTKTPLGAHLKKWRDRGEQYDKFHQALGGFVSSFSGAEMAVTLLLWHVSGVSEEVAKAIFSGTRIKEAISFINRIYDATGEAAIKNGMKRYFDHLGAINDVRNDVLHYGAPLVGTDFAIVSNALAAHTAAKLRELELSVLDLKNMSHDLHLITTVIREVRGGTTPDRLHSLPHAAILLAPWRCKLPLPTVPRERIRRILAGLVPPPPSSRG
jgi:hypothetical protein